MNEREKLEVFRRLHEDAKLLVLPNAWDVASARVFEGAGFRALGTTSMGISGTLGLPDLQVVDLDTMLAAVGRICRAVDLPVTVDFEAGYADEPDQVAANVLRVIEEGAVGINVEDGTGHVDGTGDPLLEVESMCERLRAIREAVDARLPIVVNARCDVFLARVGSPAERLEIAVERGRAYRAAGADCIFVAGATERETIAELVRRIGAPINILANPTTATGLPPAPADLEALGVARLSVGSSIMKVSLAKVLHIARELSAGSFESLRADAELAKEAYALAIGANRTS